ncbi:MAG: insulinase family protein [Pseudomonadota bacterium]
MTKSGSHHPAFAAVRSEHIDSLNVQVEQYEHIKTGAMHYHLAANNTENVFLVALRTVPKDSTGIAHILEHTALCGSRRYPVRDPFFMMLRRSLNTFMNAFTSSDWTAYPFASQNRKDFDNLLDVYLDAVFFSRLDPLDFAQEGHRVEFAQPDDTESELVFKGVVFNEMKGAMSSISSTLWNSLCHHLFPTSTYHYNSGGDPEHIPDLSYAELKAFYKSHYHPSNSIFMTFGDITAAEHQAVFEERALQHFDRSDHHIQVQPEQRLDKPLRVSERYALDETESTTGKTHLVMAWMLGESTDLEQLLEAQLLSSVLLDNSASPLQQLLETTTLGRAPSPLCGLEDSLKELVFCCGIEGSEASHVDALEEQVLGVLQRVADEGVSIERLEAVVHQLELHQREISGDSYPYGLQLILQALGCATHYSDPIAVLDLEPVIERLRLKIQQPDYIRDLARGLLLDNNHRVTLVMTPDTTLAAERQQREEQRLADIKRSMGAEQRDATVQLASNLLARQSQIDDDSILPKVELTDVPGSIPEPQRLEATSHGIALANYRQGTNGIVYQQVIRPLPKLDTQRRQYLPLYSHMLTELGLGTQTYLDVQERQAATVGSLSAFTSLRSAVTDVQSVEGFFALSSKALARNAPRQSQLLYDTLQGVRFDEADRLRDLMQALLARREQAVPGSGHSLAMTAACAGISPLAKLQHQQSGLEGIRWLRDQVAQLQRDPSGQALREQLEAVHGALSEQPLQLLAIADEGSLEGLADATAALFAEVSKAQAGQPFELESVGERRAEMWLTNTQVNFCARAYPTVPIGHADAPALTVLGGLLRNGFLHRAIREQGGAYGGGAAQDSGAGSFRFYSYRDPRLAETLADFDTSIDWLLNTDHSAQTVEEAVLGVVGSMDRPSSPAGEAKQHFFNVLHGRSHEQREVFRQAVLQVNAKDLKRVAEHYLSPTRASTAVITHSGQTEATAGLREQLDMALLEL